MISDSHPILFLSQLLEKKSAEFFFSKYIYLPDSLFDEREVFSVKGQHLTVDRISQEIASLRTDQELALHSTVKIGGRTFHIPMIDFSAEHIHPEDVFDRMSRYLQKSVLLSMAVYSSGRSFHAYSTTLLSPKEWLQFMGRLLLVNPRNAPELVDTRWVGHRLIGGFSSLRWSNNSGQYLGLPSRIAFP